MSWAEVKKLNSDLSTPLNIANLINHIDLIGSSYLGSADTSVEICKTNAILEHSIARQVILSESLSTQEKMDSYGYKCLCAIANTDYSTFADFADMMASETAMNAIGASETAMTAITASATAMTMLDTGNKTVPEMITYTLPSGVVTSNSEKPGYHAWKLFDKMSGEDNSWIAPVKTNVWVQYEFPNPTFVYKVDVRALGNTSSLKHYKIEYSMNNTDWVEAVDDTFPAYVDAVRTNICTPSRAARYWRIWVYDNFSGSATGVAEMQLYGREFV